MLEPIERSREWMDQTPHKGANRYLPLVIANQAGWVVRCPGRFKANWNGKRDPESLTLEFPDKNDPVNTRVHSLFGLGIVSFLLPWLFRTSEGVALWVRGPSNYAKDNIAPLEGIVETDWSPYTFTMNWRIMKPKTDIWFRKGDPVCMLVPYPLGMLEDTKTRVTQISEDADLEHAFRGWSRVRHDQYRQLGAGKPPEKVWQLDYVRGSKPDGTFAGSHFPKLNLDRFDAPKSE